MPNFARPHRPPGPETSRAAKREDTKKRLVDAAESLIRARGYLDVTVTEIAQAAGVVPSLINTYFDGKAGLLYAIVERHNAPQLESTRAAAEGTGTARERLERIVLAWARGDLSHARLLGALQALTWYWPPEIEQQNARDRGVFMEVVADVLREGMADGSMRTLPVAPVCEAILGIYAWGLRPGVFAGATAENCVASVMAQLDLMLRK